MALDQSGERLTGSEASDIEPYLAEYTAAEQAYPATAFYPVACPCGSGEFRLVRASDITQRMCRHCGQVRYICRDVNPIHWEEAEEEEEPEPYACVACDTDVANVCLGFAGYPVCPEVGGVKWFYVGIRCCACGVLDCFNDGKVGRAPMNSEVFSLVAGEPDSKAR
jgi:hypothetical protein